MPHIFEYVLSPRIQPTFPLRYYASKILQPFFITWSMKCRPIYRGEEREITRLRRMMLPALHMTVESDMSISLPFGVRFWSEVSSSRCVDKRQM